MSLMSKILEGYKTFPTATKFKASRGIWDAILVVSKSKDSEICHTTLVCQS